MLWAQLTLLALNLIYVGIHMGRHNQPRKDKYNGVGAFIGAAISTTLLFFAGAMSAIVK